MAANVQSSSANFASLPQEIILGIARESLRPNVNKHQKRAYPHSNECNIDIISADHRGRAALLDILRLETVWIEVKFHECVHICANDPRTMPVSYQRILGEGTHASLGDVFGDPLLHPVLRLKRAGQIVHVIQLNLRCGPVCQPQDTAVHTLAFVPAQNHHILALCPILQRMQKPGDAASTTAFIELLTNGIDQTYPMVRREADRAVELVQKILPGVHHGSLTRLINLRTIETLEGYYGGQMDQDGWPLMEPYLRHYLAELENAFKSGIPLGELAALSENFMNNKLFINFGSHGINRDFDNASFVSALNIFNKYSCIFMSGLAEYLLRGAANMAQQTHPVLNNIVTEPHFLWIYFNRVMEVTVGWATRIMETYNRRTNFSKPCKENFPLFLSSCAVVLADCELRFAMARARRVQPSLRVYQDMAYISRMATPKNLFYDRLDSEISRQISICKSNLIDLISEIWDVMQGYKLNTQEALDIYSRAEELLRTIETEVRENNYDYPDWTGNYVEERSVDYWPCRFRLVQLEPTDPILCMVDEFRRKNDGVFSTVRPAP